MEQEAGRDARRKAEQPGQSKYKDEYASSYAVVIGIDRYADPELRPLGNAENDATKVAEVLSGKPYEFQVTKFIGEQATKGAINRALSEIIRNSQDDDRVIFYFAGHGYVHKDNRGFESGYLACADTDPRDPLDGLEYDEVKKLSRYAKAKHIAYLLDACFSGTIFGMRAGSPTAAIQEYLLHPAYQVLTAGAVEVVSDARSMGGELVRVLKEGIPGQEGPLTFDHLAAHVKDTIHNQSKGRQTPMYGPLEGSGKGQMVLFRPSPIDSLTEDLRKGLTHNDPLTRRFAITEAEKLLNDARYGQAVQAVLEGMQLDDPDREVRNRAIKALKNAPPVQVEHSAPQKTGTAAPVEKEKEPPPKSSTGKPNQKEAQKEEQVSTRPPQKPADGVSSTPKSAARDRILELLPAPFEWCSIPAGKVTLEYNAGAFEVKPFKMAKYPITYAQFQVFIEAADGFKKDAWWQGLAKRETQPGDQKWKIANHPRERVSWYDAVAFCRWLSDKVGYEVRLPAEWEWQWAAQGPDGRQYPWGKEYLQGYANVDEKTSKIKNGVYLEKTTPVGSYPQGASPYGVLDMAGNVWEWCLNEYENPGE